MGISRRIRNVVRKAGVDISRWPQGDPGYLSYCAFVANRPDVIVDVGANTGQAGLEFRAYGFSGRLVSLEPLAAPFHELADVASNDQRWDAFHVALGSEPGELMINVAANGGESSSFLPMTAAHSHAAPHANFIAQESVRVTTFDELRAQHGSSWRRPALKIDVQGFEREVLEGCKDSLESVCAIRLELSLVELYADSWSWLAAIDYLGDRGFDLVGIDPGFSDPVSGRLLQFDGVFAPRRYSLAQSP